MSDDGAAGLTLLLAAALFVVVGLAAVTAVGDLAVTSARARTAADAAALAGAATSPLVAPAGVPAPRAAAEAAAAANRADLVTQDTAAWPLRYGVTVAVQPSTTWVKAVVGALEARATAGIRPRRDGMPGEPGR